MSLKADAAGRVYAATKTSSVSASDPLSLLLVRDTDGTRSTRVVGTVTTSHTRPIVVLDEARGRLHVLATRGQDGGPIVRKSTSLSAPSFATGAGEAVMDDTVTDDLNDVLVQAEHQRGERHHRLRQRQHDRPLLARRHRA